MRNRRYQKSYVIKAVEECLFPVMDAEGFKVPVSDALMGSFDSLAEAEAAMEKHYAEEPVGHSLIIFTLYTRY